MVTSNHLDAVHRTITRFWGRFSNPPEDRWRMLFELAVAEVAANILEHALPPQMTFTMRVRDGCVAADFVDTGSGWGGPSEPRDIVDLMAERGRGLAIANAAVDEVVYERLGAINHWRLLKRL
jgi:serine/threonine-protein kinase RsbW